MQSDTAFFESLKLSLKSLAPLSDVEWSTLRNYFTPKTVAAKNTIVEEGQIADELYFICSGLARLYYKTENGDEVTAFIFKEYMFAGCLESFLKQEPGN